MAIVDDYAGIAAELRRIRAEKSPPEKPAEAPREPASQHRMRTTIPGELVLIDPRRSGPPRAMVLA
jgi:hypothetical protein